MNAPRRSGSGSLGSAVAARVMVGPWPASWESGAQSYSWLTIKQEVRREKVGVWQGYKSDGSCTTVAQHDYELHALVSRVCLRNSYRIIHSGLAHLYWIHDMFAINNVVPFHRHEPYHMRLL